MRPGSKFRLLGVILCQTLTRQTGMFFLATFTLANTRKLLIDATNPEITLFKKFSKQVRQLVAGLQAVAIQPGDCVCVNAFNDVSNLHEFTS